MGEVKAKPAFGRTVLSLGLRVQRAPSKHRAPRGAGAQPQGGVTHRRPPCPGRTCCCRSCLMLTDMGCRILVDHTLLRWGRRSFEWRWRAIALATAGCALPAPCAELRATRAAALSIRPLAAPAASPHPTTFMDTLPLSLLCLERVPPAAPTSQGPTSPMERGPLDGGR